MRKMLKENKGFSLVELLVAILIMAVIAGTAITLFGGVLNSSRENADKETAESIKRAILTYMNSTNDVDLDCLGISDTNASSLLIQRLGLELTISNTVASPAVNAKAVVYKKPEQAPAAIQPAAAADIGDASDINGTFGPFLDATKDMNPKRPGAQGWAIKIDSEMQVVTVDSVDTVAAAIVDFLP